MPQSLAISPGTVGFRIKKIGLVNFDRLYKEARTFFDSYHYIFNETQHKGKDAEKGRKLDIIWSAFREVDDYARFVIKVNFVLFRIN